MKAIKVFAVILALSLMCLSAFSQGGVAINTDGSDPDASAILDIQSTVLGLLTPRMTESERDLIPTPAVGLMIYQTDGRPGYYFYDGTAWKSIGAGVLGINDLTDGSTISANLFLGINADNLTPTSSANVGIGNGIFNNLSSGNNNVALGNAAGNNITSGSHNIMLGVAAQSSDPTANNELNIGHALYATGLYGSSPKVGIGNANNAPNSTLGVGGSMALPMVPIHGPYTLTDQDYTILVATPTTITLPDPTNITGRIYIIKKGAGANTVTITGNGYALDSYSVVELTTDYSHVQVQSAGAIWIIIGGLNYTGI